MTKNRQNPFELRDASLDALKLIAMILMVLDHVNEAGLGEAYPWMSYLGRGAYPLFAFAMASHLLRRPNLSVYLQRMIVFALLSQPFYALAFHQRALNVLFTLALGAIAGAWVLEEPRWRRHALFLSSLPSFFFKDVTDFDLAGIALPGLLALALTGDRVARLWTVLALVLLNVDLSDFASLEQQRLVLSEWSWAPLILVTFTLVVPWLSYWFCARLPGPRFVPKYTFYIFYPAHLLLLALYRLYREAFPFSLLST